MGFSFLFHTAVGKNQKNLYLGSLEKSPEKLPLCQLKLLMTEPAQETVPRTKYDYEFQIGLCIWIYCASSLSRFHMQKKASGSEQNSRPPNLLTNKILSQETHKKKYSKLNAMYVLCSLIVALMEKQVGNQVRKCQSDCCLGERNSTIFHLQEHIYKSPFEPCIWLYTYIYFLSACMKQVIFFSQTLLRKITLINLELTLKLRDGIGNVLVSVWMKLFSSECLV